MSFVDLAIPFFINPSNGKPVYSGSIYIGEPDTDPEIAVNQKTIRLRQEDGTEVVTAQPVQTSIGGVPLYNGSPVQILVDGDYSIKVLDNLGAQVYYVSSTLNVNPASVLNISGTYPTLADLKLAGTYTDAAAYLSGRITSGDGGQGWFRWNGSDLSIEVASDPQSGVYVPPSSDVTGASGAWVREYDGAILLEWFGVNETNADNSTQFQAALSFANGNPVEGKPGANYNVTSQLDFSNVDFDGRGCTITKNHAGVGVNITGGPVYTYISNFDLLAGASFRPSDYNAAAADHGIVVNGTRVEAKNVVSSFHNGAGWYLNSSSGNMNKSKYLEIEGDSNALAGCYLAGTVDNMSVWEFNGQFQSNYGYGIFATDDCALRQVNMWLYCEDNFNGASAPPAGYAAEFGKIRASKIYAYVEQQTGSGLELRLGANSQSTYVESTRANADLIEGVNCVYRIGNRFSDKSALRTGTPLVIRGDAARIANFDEYTQVLFEGNDGDFGYVRGSGESSGNPSIGFFSDDESRYLRLASDALLNNSQKFFRSTDSLNLRDFGLVKTTPTTNQVTLTISFADTTTRYGSALAEVYLCGDTDTSPSDANYIGRFPVAVRAGSAVMTAFARQDEYAAGLITVNSVVASGTNLIITFDVTATVISVTGHVTVKGGMGYANSAVLS